MKKNQIYNLALSDQQRQEKENDIEKNISLSSKKRIVNTTIVSDDIAIVEVINKANNKEEHLFYPLVGGQVTTEVSYTFDYALIIAISHKYRQNSAPSMIYNMLRLDEF